MQYISVYNLDRNNQYTYYLITFSWFSGYNWILVFNTHVYNIWTNFITLLHFSVSSLKAAIERKTKIAASSLVLLVSGGEVLQSDHMVSSYSAGTDTNPIYMFSKPSEKESHLKQSSKYRLEFWGCSILDAFFEANY